MKRNLLFLLAIGLGLCAKAQLVGGTTYQINGSPDNTAGPVKTFATLRSAATYVNANGLTGSGQAFLEFTASYTNETIGASSITFNALPGASATLGITIRPATGKTVTLTASLAGLPIIDLDNADYITLDGRAGGAGTASTFTVENTSTSAATSVVRLINGAQYNQLSYLTIKTAAAAGITGGGVLLGTSSGTTGNTNNIISYNTFSIPSTGYVANSTQPCQILSVGTAALPNHNNSILNNNFTHWGGRGAVYSSSGNNWQINDNHFYSNISVKGSGTAISGGIVIDGTNAHSISGNFFGGQAASAGGSKMTLDALNWNFIYVNGNSTGAKTTIQNNIIANMNAGTPATNDVVEFNAICTIGNQIVDVLSNTIGSASVANSLVMNKNNSLGAVHSLIRADNTGNSASNISNNTLANVQYNETVNAGNNSFLGIYSSAGTGNKIIDNNTINQISTAGRITRIGLITTHVLSEITNNKIGSQSATNDIMLTSTITGNYRYGINAIGNVASKITGNQLGGITLRTTAATGSAFNFFSGINAYASTNKTVQNNLVGGTVANSIQSIVGGGAAQAYIQITGITSESNALNNTIRNITGNEHGMVVGISGSNTIQNNVIELLTVNSQSSSSNLNGIEGSGTGLVNGNTISGLKSTNAVSIGGAAGYRHVAGIFVASTGTINNNRIFNLEATGAGATSVVGIVGNSSSITKNRVYDLKSSNGTAAGAYIAGMVWSVASSAARTASNNIVHINHSGNIRVYGFLSEIPIIGDGEGQVDAYYNTILLEGTATGSAISSAIYRANASPVNLKNNLLFNNRTGGSGIRSLYGTNNIAPAWVSDYNFLASATGNAIVGNWNGTAQNFAAWKTGHSGQDVNSINEIGLTPNTFFDMTLASNSFLKTTESNKLKIAEKGTPVSVTSDILGTTRATLPTMGAFEEVVVLPVTFNGFNAKLNGNKVNLNWSVGSESEIIRYEVERSVDGTNFIKVATANAGQFNAYTAVDASPKLGINYYRLLAINADGTASYFKDIAEVKVASLNEGTALVYPNPILGNTVNVSMATYGLGTYTYRLSDITGKLLQKGSFEHKGGSNSITISAAMPKGVYVLQIGNGREQIQAKLIKP